jgi:CRISPR-associated endonuclease Csy4
LVEQQNPDKTVNFGVSFPEYKYEERDGKEFAGLGAKLRIFAPTKQELERLDINKWLARLIDYVHIKSIQIVPSDPSCYLLVKRYRPDINLERLTRRFKQRESKRLGKELSFDEAKAMQQQRFITQNNISLQQAEKLYQQPKVKSFPFIRLKSSSTLQSFSLQLDQQSVNQPVAGVFNTYGLSANATVPHW